MSHPIDQRTLEMTLMRAIAIGMDVPEPYSADDDMGPEYMAMRAIDGDNYSTEDGMLTGSRARFFDAGMELAIALVCAISNDPLRVDKTAVQRAFKYPRGLVEAAAEEWANEQTPASKAQLRSLRAARKTA